jgi:transposase
MYVTITGKDKYRVIQFREDTRIPGTNKRKAHIVKTIGNYEKLLLENPNIVEELKEEAKRLTLEKKSQQSPVVLEVSSSDILKADDVTPSFHFGHCLIKELWKKLKLDKFFLDKVGKRDAQLVIEAIFYLLLHRCTDPKSIYASAKQQEKYAGIKDISLDRLYDILDVLDSSKEEMVSHLSKYFEKNTNRNQAKAYYDVTTYSFESTKWGELRMFGFSKNGKNNEVQVVMGLLIDSNGIPVTYELFPGNTMDQTTLVKSVNRLKVLYNLDKITVVADRRLNSGSNLEYLYSQNHDFVISYTLKKSSQEFKKLVWDEDGWKIKIDSTTGEVLGKEKVVVQDLQIKIPISEISQSKDSKKRGRPRKYDKKSVPVKIHLTWSPQRAAKDASDRTRMLDRLKKKLDKPYQLKASVKRGMNQFLEMELETENWKLNEEKILESERYDGYYAVITNNMDLSTEEVVKIYRGLWRIEESFRILKTDLRARPVYLWTDSHVRGHFALCFLALSIMRYTQHLLLENSNHPVSVSSVMQAINQPQVLVQGEYPKVIVTPICVNELYLELSRILDMKPLKKNMTLTQFRTNTKLNLSVNLE